MNKFKVAKNIHNIVYLLILSFIIFSFYLSYKFIDINFFNLHGDSAGLVDLINNISQQGKSISSLWSSSRPFLKIWEDIELICQQSFRDLNEFDFNMLDNHGWYISYFFSYILKIGVSSKSLVTILSTSSFYFVLLLVLFYTYKKKLNSFIALIFIFLIIINPLFSESLFGQLYLSKISIFPVVLFLFIYTKELKVPKSFLITLVLGFFILSFHERVSFFLGIFILLDYCFKYLEKKKINWIDNFFIIFSLFCFSVFIFKIINSSSPHLDGNFKIFENISMIINNENYQDKILKMILVLSPLLFFSIFCGKHFFTLIIFLMPNILTNIGGAEKLGWSVHYHSYFSPYLIFFSTIGFKNFYNLIYLKNKNNFTFFLPLGLLLFSSIIDPYNEKKIFKLRSPLENRLFLNNKYVLDENNYKLLSNSINKKILFFAEVKKNSSISMRENHTPYFAGKQFNEISFFPIGVGLSDYLLIDYELKKNNQFEITLDAFRPSKKKKQNALNCINKIIEDKYFLVNSIETSIQTKTKIFKKIN